LTASDDRDLHEEQRFITIGLLRTTVVVIVHTEAPELIRVISMRKATRHETEIYFAQIGNQLETDPRDEGRGH
jgi:uncharacterized protein